MTTLAVAIDAVKARWLALWAAVTPTPPTGFDNEAFAPPVDGSAFARLSVAALPDQGATLGAIGSRRITRRAVVILQIASPLDAGDGASTALVETARNIFERVSISDLAFEDATVRQGRSDGRWWLVRIDVPFFFAETK